MDGRDYWVEVAPFLGMARQPDRLAYVRVEGHVGDLVQTQTEVSAARMISGQVGGLQSLLRVNGWLSTSTSVAVPNLLKAHGLADLLSVSRFSSISDT